MSEMNLSKQAIGAIMMALQKSLMEQTDIVPVFEGFRVKLSDEGLVVLNPPLIRYNEEVVDFEDETEEGESTQQNATSESA
tara:strand:- start:2948 stop:3190 length:243 start_codon:yes stop_codon:yes gene_type:complete